MSMELEAKGKRASASTSCSILAGDDRLSSLPDPLIHHIMSFMKVRQVVQTCVLSTRWEHLWRSVPCLNIDREEFKTKDRDSEEWEKFADFTDHLLIPNNISIALLDTFQLHIGTDLYCRDGQAARWIRHGIKYSTRQGLLSSSWRIKTLHLSNVYLDSRFMDHVRSGCQYLEDLELKGCRCVFHEITSHSLKNLILKDCGCYRLSAITSHTLQRLVIDRCKRTSDDGLLASIHLLGNGPFRSKLGDDQFKLLDSVSNVTSLYLSDFKAMVPCEEFPEFNNLGTLLLDQCDLSDNFQTLAYFLQSAPNLEKLTLRRCKFSKDPMKNEREGQVEQGCPNQLEVRCKNLKHTEIIYKDHDVQKLVELLLSISGSLPKNNIKLTKVDSPHR
ncbi:unnamed protein product [Urochloa decumbens]|uniref:F-box domain-containing protein n=1 Tax=Urochloa decumbens TaxID=240449 RepID=A0ABC9CX28_9POAL